MNGVVQSYRSDGLWTTHRAESLTARLHALAAKDTLRWTWEPAPATVLLNYFAGDTDEGLLNLPGFQYVRATEDLDWSGIDVLILTAHGGDMAERVMNYRVRNPDMLIVLWLWDNHLAQVNNLKSVLAADLYFPSHWSEAAYLQNMVAPLGMHVPACSAQWTSQEARALLAQQAGRPRSDALLLNYVEYAFSWRTEVLARLRAELPAVSALLMPSHDRARYFAKGSDARMAEWAGYKCTLILPVTQDLSTRLFDALLAGLVPIVPRSIADFDQVVSPAEQERLGVVRVDNVETATVARAVAQAVAVFDEQGEAGVAARSEFVLQGHMLHHRMTAMLRAVRAAGAPQRAVRLTAGEEHPLAMRFVQT